MKKVRMMIAAVFAALLTAVAFTPATAQDSPGDTSGEVCVDVVQEVPVYAVYEREVKGEWVNGQFTGNYTTQWHGTYDWTQTGTSLTPGGPYVKQGQFIHTNYYLTWERKFVDTGTVESVVVDQVCCPEGMVPGWLDEFGYPQGCVNNDSTPSPEPEPTVTPEPEPTVTPAPEEEPEQEDTEPEPVTKKAPAPEPVVAEPTFTG